MIEEGNKEKEGKAQSLEVPKFPKPRFPEHRGLFALQKGSASIQRVWPEAPDVEVLLAQEACLKAVSG